MESTGQRSRGGLRGYRLVDDVDDDVYYDFAHRICRLAHGQFARDDSAESDDATASDDAAPATPLGR